MTDTPLWALGLNAAMGVFLAMWMMATLVPFLLDLEPLLPGMEQAFIASSAWATWNAKFILRSQP